MVGVAYIFATTGRTVSYKLQQMILPQLEEDRHVADVKAMFFFDDNTFFLARGNTYAELLVEIAKEKDITLMMCDQCALERGLAIPEGRPPGKSGDNPLNDNTSDIGPDFNVNVLRTVDDSYIKVGCFPDLYEDMSDDPPDYVITL